MYIETSAFSLLRALHADLEFTMPDVTCRRSELLLHCKTTESIHRGHCETVRTCVHV